MGDIVGATARLDGKTTEVRGVEVVSDHILKITIEAPKPNFLAKLATAPAYVLDRDNIESGASWSERPNGTGPFKLREYIRGERLILERNNRYYRGTPRLETRPSPQTADVVSHVPQVRRV